MRLGRVKVRVLSVEGYKNKIRKSTLKVAFNDATTILTDRNARVIKTELRRDEFITHTDRHTIYKTEKELQDRHTELQLYIPRTQCKVCAAVTPRVQPWCAQNPDIEARFQPQASILEQLHCAQRFRSLERHS